MEILLPVIILGSLGIIFGLWLTFAQKIFAVKGDAQVEHIFSLLPGSNCGACGQAGCYGLAEALGKGKVETITCPALADKEREEIADILGIKIDAQTKQIATLICGGGTNCKDKFKYHGPKDCNIATILMDGPKACGFGCIGYGSCVGACPFDAVKMNEENLPIIDPEKCTGCGKCLKVCPKDVLVLSPIKSEYHIYCNSKDRGSNLMKACEVGCIGCGKCVKECPVEAIELKDNLAKIDYNKCINCGKCIKICPTKAIIRRDKDGGKYNRPE